MKKILITLVIAFSICSNSMAAQKKSLADIDIDAFMTDTQVTPQGAGDNHVSLVWWVPNEYWQSIFSRDTTTSEFDKKAVLDTMSGISLLAVVQSDISTFGAFKFYSKEEIEKNMLISFSDANGKKHELLPAKKIDSDLEIILESIKPILGAAMGNLGTNMHFYVLNDKSKASSRIIDPYQKGQIDIKLLKRDNKSMAATIEMPLNSLFIPRKCPNGKDAHISWKYCPWTGKLLEE